MDWLARTEGLVQRVVEAEELELVHVEFVGEGRQATLRIYIDKPGSVNLTDCQKVSKHVSLLLDVEDFIPHHYVLEVSSPGLERPLFKEQDFQRFKGREARVMTIEAIESRRKFTGFIQEFGGGVLHLACDDRTYCIPFDKIRKAHLVHRFANPAGR
jgi:ribosome maturation factor RimP